MEYPDLRAENLLHPFNDLGCQGNFRQQVEHLFPLIELLADQVDIEFGLSAGGDSLQQDSLVLLKLGPDGIQCPGLLQVKCEWCPDSFTGPDSSLL